MPRPIAGPKSKQVAIWYRARLAAVMTTPPVLPDWNGPKSELGPPAHSRPGRLGHAGRPGCARNSASWCPNAIPAPEHQSPRKRPSGEADDRLLLICCYFPVEFLPDAGHGRRRVAKVCHPCENGDCPTQCGGAKGPCACGAVVESNPQMVAAGNALRTPAQPCRPSIQLWPAQGPQRRAMSRMRPRLARAPL